MAKGTSRTLASVRASSVLPLPVENGACIDFDVGVAALIAEAKTLVVIMNSDREHLLGARLTDHILVEFVLDGARRRNVGEECFRSAAAALFLVDDRLAEFDALAADVHVARAFHERADIAVALAAKRAIGVAIAPGAARRPPPPGAAT
jgi:hypothetical protein